jgi:hypothetical protein
MIEYIPRNLIGFYSLQINDYIRQALPRTKFLQ